MTSLASPTQSRIVHLSGHISASNASHCREQLKQSLLAHAPTQLFLDLSQVDFLDSAGLMVLVDTLAVAQQVDSQLILCSIPASVQIILELSQLNRAFTIMNTPPSMARSASEQLAIAA